MIWLGKELIWGCVAGPTVLRGIDPRLLHALADNPDLLRALIQVSNGSGSWTSHCPSMKESMAVRVDPLCPSLVLPAEAENWENIVPCHTPPLSTNPANEDAVHQSSHLHAACAVPSTKFLCAIIMPPLNQYGNCFKGFFPAPVQRATRLGGDQDEEGRPGDWDPGDDDEEDEEGEGEGRGTQVTCRVA